MFKNILWDFAGKFSVQMVGFGISIILTRLLSPSEFGVMGMALAIIVIAHVFLDLGFNRAIIQQKEVSQTQYSTIFFLNAVVALSLTAICFFLANPLAHFYNQPLINPVFKILSISFLINGLNLVPAAILYKKLQLKLNSILTLTSSLLSGIVGVTLAYKGYGVWSLVIQSLLNSCLLLILNFICAKWVPSFCFSFSSIKPLWKYGSRMFASGLLDNLYNKLDTFIIGKVFSTATLGYYARAQSMDNFVRQFSVNSIMGALFPYIAKHQDDRVFLNELYKKYLHIISFASIALSGTLFLIAKYLFVILFTSRWQYSADLFQLISIIGFAWPVSSIMCNIIAGVGNSAAFFRLEIYKKILLLPVYLFGFIFGLKGFIICFIIANFIAVIINAIFVSNEIEIKAITQLKIIISYFFSGVCAVILSYYLHRLIFHTNSFFSLIILTVLFNLFFLSIIYVCKLDAIINFNQILKKIKLIK